MQRLLRSIPPKAEGFPVARCSAYRRALRLRSPGPESWFAGTRPGLRNRRQRLLRPIIVSLLLVVAACGSEPSEEGRRFASALADTLFVVGGTPADTTLLNPNTIRPWMDGVVVFETEGSRLVAIDGRGSVRWTYSRTGQGPGELLGPVDGFADPDGVVTVLDYANRKFVRVSAAGRFQDEVRLPELSRLPWEVARVSDGEALVADNSTGQVRIVDIESGSTVGSLDVPLPDTVPTRANRMVALDARLDQDSWVMGLKWGPMMWLGQGNRVIDEFSLVHQPGYRLPRPTIEVADGVRMPDPTTPAPVNARGATSISFDDAGIFVLTGGSIGGDPSTGANDIIDVYGPNGSYERSYRLPVEAFSHAKIGSTLFLMFLDPAPGILALRLPEVR